jgi:UDP-glucoronosyl and UDP-glucosyl transferase
MDKAVDGVVLIVFGTSYDISKTSERFLQVFFKTFEAFPKLHFVVNWEGHEPKEVPQNLYLSTWLPQKTLLGNE